MPFPQYTLSPVTNICLVLKRVLSACLQKASETYFFKFLCNAHDIPGANVCKIVAISSAERMEFRIGAWVQH